MTADPKHQTIQKTADTGKSVHLSASAGSGKTRALKDRFLALLEGLDRVGLNIDQAVAITFTDKAAAEIKERVMQDLPERMLKKIVRGRQDLRISTIHSFCMNLLKRYPLEAGLPPDFEVLDSRDQAYKIQKAIEDAIEESDQDTELMAPLSRFTVEEIISCVEFLISIRSRLKRMEIDAGGPDSLVQSIRDGMEIGAAEAEIRGLIVSGEWRTSFERMEKLLTSEGDQYASHRGAEHRVLAEAQDPASAFKTAGPLFPIYFTQEGTPRKTAKISVKSFATKHNRREYETLFFKIQELLYRLKNAYLRVRSAREAVSLLILYLRAEEKYLESKLKEGLLDFDDLEIFAYRLLQGTESPDILYWLDRKILHFLVDEFQDTSDIQWAILKKLTEEIFSGVGADKPLPPTLFVVGDEKQSIYRFREANYRLLHDIREQMEKNIPRESREILTLDKNFRSTPGVIETVNTVFSGLWGGSYKPAATERTKHTGSAALIEIRQDDAAERPLETDEARILAHKIKALVDEQIRIYERSGEAQDGWKERPAGYGDCAVLIQSRAKLKEYEAALQAQSIPYRVVGGIGFYEEDEIQALINVLFFLWDHADTLALAAALKSPLFGFLDKDLFDLLQDGGDLFDSLKRNKPDIGKVLAQWIGIAKLIPISGLLHKIIEETGAYVRFGRHNPQAIFNIDKLLDTAREFDRRGYTTLQDFVERIKNIKRTEHREATSDMNLPGTEGSVSILTVHKAKGLEYPIVLLPGMNQSARSLTIGPQALIQERDGQRRMAIKDANNPVYEDLWKGDQGEQEELRREHQRLLYVAMTRARDHLIMIGTLGSNKTPVKQNTWLDFLRQTLPLPQKQSSDAKATVVTYAYPDWQAGPLEGTAETSRTPVRQRTQEAIADGKKIIENISRLPRSETVEWKKPTDFIVQENGAAREEISLTANPQTVSASTRGSVLHRCLEEYTKNGAYELNRIMQEFPEFLALERGARQSFADDAETVLKKVLSQEAFSWIFEQREGTYTELPFLYNNGRDLISGIMDRVIIKGSTGFVIDYKAIRIENEESLASWTSHYRPQIRMYCEAAKELFGLATVEGYLLFLDSNKLELVNKT